MIGYVTRSQVEAFLNRTFSEVTDVEFNLYIASAEKWINNYTGYNSQTSTSGMMYQQIVREKNIGKVDSTGNLFVPVKHAPIAMDANYNPLVSLLEFNVGSVRVQLQLTDGSSNATNTVMEVSEDRRNLYYPALYYLPAVSSVTPTAKLNLYDLRSIKFWTDITYYGGYVTLPEDVQLATIYIVSDFLQHRDNPLFLQSASQGTMSQTFGGTSKNKAGFNAGRGFELAQMLLQNYVRVSY